MYPPGSPSKVEQNARARVTGMGGDCSDRESVLALHTLQFGRYQGKSFLWLLSNDIG